jgi:hypothetical protein
LRDIVQVEVAGKGIVKELVDNVDPATKTLVEEEVGSETEIVRNGKLLITSKAPYDYPGHADYEKSPVLTASEICYEVLCETI